MTTSRPPQLANGILTSWIPLTTTGPTFSQTCSSAIYMPPGQEILAAFDPWYGQNINPAQACLVKEQTTWWDQTAAPSTTYLLGPFACPTEYYQVASSSVDATSTLIACCPSNYKYLGTIYSAPTPSQCVSIATSGEVVTYIGDSSGTWAQNSTIFGAGGGTIIGGQLNGYIFADAVTTSSSSSSTLASTTSSTSNTIAQQTSSISSSTSSSTSTAISAPVSSGFSSGAKIGVGIGAALGVVGIAALVSALLIRRRANARRVTPVEMYSGDGFLDAPRHDGHDVNAGLDSSMSGSGSDMHKSPQMNEMHAQPYAAEVHADRYQNRSEMAG